MTSAKELLLRPVSWGEADEFIRRVHYSGKVPPGVQLSIGVFLHGRMEGALQFGPSLDKRKLQGLVAGTGWNEFIELNRMAFTDALPRNSESRALAISLRLMRKYAPHIKWVVSFADAAQCGDGTIYRAAGFVLTGIRKNTAIWASEDGSVRVMSKVVSTFNAPRVEAEAYKIFRQRGVKVEQVGSLKPYREAGFRPIPGFQLRYLYFIDPSCRERLTVPVLPFSEIAARGAGMYLGERRAEGVASDTPGFQPGEGGAVPTSALHENEAN